jgi:hypothetical protein
MPELGDKPIQKEHFAMMNEIARNLDRAFNGNAKGTDRKIGFIMMVFDMNGEPGLVTDSRCNFISNGANRQDVVALMKEMIARFEGQAQTPEGHA